jgi:hypothetical protein
VFGTYGVEIRSQKCDFSKVTICFYDEHELPRDEGGNYVRFQLPVSYNSTLKEFELYGSFCSLECARAFLYQKHQRPLINVEKVQSIFPLYVRRVVNPDYKHEHTHFVNRPHKFALQRYGGPLSITEFRSKWCNSIRYVVYRMLPSYPGFRQVQVIVDEYMYPQMEKGHQHPPQKKKDDKTGVGHNENDGTCRLEQNQPTETHKSGPAMKFPPRRMPVHIRNQTLAALIKQ